MALADVHLSENQDQGRHKGSDASSKGSTETKSRPASKVQSTKDDRPDSQQKAEAERQECCNIL